MITIVTIPSIKRRKFEKKYPLYYRFESWKLPYPYHLEPRDYLESEVYLTGDHGDYIVFAKNQELVQSVNEYLNEHKDILLYESNEDKDYYQRFIGLVDEHK